MILLKNFSGLNCEGFPCLQTMKGHGYHHISSRDSSDSIIHHSFIMDHKRGIVRPENTACSSKCRPTSLPKSLVAQIPAARSAQLSHPPLQLRLGVSGIASGTKWFTSRACRQSVEVQKACDERRSTAQRSHIAEFQSISCVLIVSLGIWFTHHSFD